jgi:hypothetical protein
MDAYNIAICLAPTLIPVPEEKKIKLIIKLILLSLLRLLFKIVMKYFQWSVKDYLMKN